MRRKFPDGFYEKHEGEILEKIFELSRLPRCLDDESKRKLQGFLEYLYERDLDEERIK